MVRAEQGIGNGGNDSERSGVKIPSVGSRVVHDDERLIPIGFSIAGRQEKQVKARTERHKDYPPRVHVPDGTTWQTLDRENYHPADYTASKVKVKPVWADPEDPHDVPGYPDFPTYEGTIELDADGRSLNPMGPTGLKGRGVLGKWGANFAADPIVTRITDEGEFQMIAIKRKDEIERDDIDDKDDIDEWAIPGGMVDKGERVTQTLKRELGEEASAHLDFANAAFVYQGGVDDPRNTDNSHIETDAYHLHLTPEQHNIELKAGSDAKNARWMTVTKEYLAAMYANHADFMRLAIQQWQEKTGLVIDKDGHVVDQPLR